MLGLIRPYAAVALAVLLALMLGAAYVRGRSDGRAVEAQAWQRRAAAAEAQALADRETISRALAERQAQLDAKTREAADAVAQIRTEYLPAKTVVRREVAERVVYRECRVGGGMRDTLDAALRGRPAAGALGPVAGDRAGVSG